MYERINDQASLPMRLNIVEKYVYDTLKANKNSWLSVKIIRKNIFGLQRVDAAYITNTIHILQVLRKLERKSLIKRVKYGRRYKYKFKRGQNLQRMPISNVRKNRKTINRKKAIYK